MLDHVKASFPTRERGLKSHHFVKCKVRSVVPHAGTWIEILIMFSSFKISSVVPHAGTWIEIGQYDVIPLCLCRSPRGNVD